MAHTLEDVPCSPDAITPEWLTAAICAKTPGAIVTNVVVERSSAGTHERHRLLVTYNEVGRRAGLPASISFAAAADHAIRSHDVRFDRARRDRYG